MSIYDVNKLLSSINKSRLITHFWKCTCEKHDVNNMCLKMDISQPNMSKHISALLKYKVLNVKQIGLQRYYSINQEFKNEWKDIIEPQIKRVENYDHICSCNP